jgi:putative CocE/NonD family hydrolase
MVLVTRSVAQQEVAASREISVENSSSDPRLSPRVYPDVVSESLYITMRDGVRLAADVFHPARGSQAASESLPLIWTHDRYQRGSEQPGGRTSKMDSPYLREIVRRGYVVAAVDARGCGASFGTFTGVFNPAETEDAFEITEWFAKQPWCDGKIGMYGGSYLGATQYMAASRKPPHLLAIVPCVAPGDLYAFAYPGGIFRNDFLEHWSQLTRAVDLQLPPAPVDEDLDRALVTAARKEHEANRDTLEQFAAVPFRDSVDAKLELLPHQVMSPIGHLAEISASKVAIYHFAGWFDCFTRDALLLYHNLENPQRIVIGPWFHQQNHEIDYLGEHLRWFDHWLKGIPNGIEHEPPIHYYVMGAPAGRRWRSAWTWPLPDEKPTRFYFHVAEPGSTEGLLATDAPAGGSSSIRYRVDSTTSTGTANRWTNGYGGPPGYGDMAENDSKGVFFTSEPLAADVEITGHPVAQLSVASTAKDGDFFVYLEEVDAEGGSHYVTEGCLRASHRAMQEAPYDDFGLPYHRSFAADISDLPPGPTVLVLDLQPTSNLFDAGHCIRVTITCADRDNNLTPELSPPPEVTLWCDADHPSMVVLPILPATESDR